MGWGRVHGDRLGLIKYVYGDEEECTGRGGVHGGQGGAVLGRSAWGWGGVHGGQGGVHGDGEECMRGAGDSNALFRHSQCFFKSAQSNYDITLD